ncbi:alpha/beta hydrolase [Effusibacillus pohliae]|uniref:alpha/beta hydrolase n=1 Tax=Effusibacillus pohliae TaxID=232270 RepID=UPI00036E6FEF|nr:alpha/beta hydrolase [Effusibacillus pohliae]
MQELHFQKRLPEDQVRAAILLVHGAGEHSGRYQHVIDWFGERQLAVFAGDLPGFGRSPGRRGHIAAFAEYVETVRGWLTEAKQSVGEAPIFVLGHSMGGLVTVRLLQQTDASGLPLHGVILTSPCLRLKMQVPAWKRKMASVLNRLVPGFRLPNGIAPADVSRSPQIVQSYAADPYNERRVSVRWYNELQDAMQSASVEAGKIRHPLLLLQAGADRLVDPEAAIPFFEKLASRDKQFKIYPGCYHELLNEPEREQVLADILEWIDTRI